MPTPKMNRHWIVATGLVVGLLLLALLCLPRVRSSRVAQNPTPAPAAVAIEIPALPSPPAPPAGSADPTPVPAVVPESTTDWLAERFPDSQILQWRETPVAADGRFQREYLLETQFKYAAVEVRESWQRVLSPTATRDALLKREAWVADHFILKPRPGLNVAQLEATIIADGGVLDQTTLAESRLLIVRLPQAYLGAVEAAVAAYSKPSSPASYAEPDFLFFSAGAPNDPSFPQQTGLNNPPNQYGSINAVAGWDLRNSAAGVVVAVVDTGVRYTHQDLRVNIWQNPQEIPDNGIDDDGDGFVDNMHGANFYANTGDPTDSDGHGTHVAGILGASGNDGVGIAGVAWRVSIMPIRYQDDHGVGSDSDAVRSIGYAVSKGAQIISNSWGSNSYTQALHDAIAAANAAGVLCVCSAGNEGTNSDATPHYPSGYDLPNVISVGALYTYDRAYFSNFGVNTVDLYAPGTNVLSLGNATDTAYATFSGTSQATPHVTGMLALLKAEYPAASASWLKQRLLETAKPNVNLYTACATGGQADLYNALANVTPAPLVMGMQPLAKDLNSGEAFFLSADVTGEGPARYQWYKDGVALAGKTTQYLQFNNPTADDSGEYWVVVRNYASSVTSNKVIVQVRNTAPQLTAAPVGARVLTGQPLSLSAAFKGSLPITYQWEHDGSPVGTNPLLDLGLATTASQGAYRIKATNAYGSFTTDPVQVTVVETYLDRWDQVSPTPTSADFNSVGWLNGQFVAVGNAGTIARSADGVHWRLAPAVTTADLAAVTYGNGTYVAVGAGVILTSTDGEQWVVRPSYGAYFAEVAFGNGAFVAVAGYAAYRSTDGINWTYNAIADYAALYKPTIAFGNGRFVIAGEGYYIGSSVFTSTNGSSWTKSTATLGSSGTVSFADGVFWLTDWSGIYTSTDGAAVTRFRDGSFGRIRPLGRWLYKLEQYSSHITRYPAADPTGAVESVFEVSELPALHGLARGDDGTIVAVGEHGTILRSDSDPAFRYQSAFTSHPLVGMVNWNGQFLAVDSYGGVFTTTDGTAWEHLSDIPRSGFSTFSNLASGNGRLVVTDENHRSSTSTDGMVWSSQPIAPQNQKFGYSTLSFMGNYFWLTASYDLPACRSSDGVTWTVVTNVPVAYGGGTYLGYTYSNGYKAATSTDGLTWQLSDFPGYPSLAMCYAGGKFHAVDGSYYLTSPDGVTWTKTYTSGLPGIPSLLQQKDDIFISANYNGIYLSLDGVTWVRKSTFEPAWLVPGDGVVLAGWRNSGPPRVLRARPPFVEPAVAPVAVTTAPTRIRNRQATLAGTVDCGGAETTITFEWGTTEQFGQSLTLPVTSINRTPQSFSAVAKNLLSNTLYYYRISATNSAGSSQGLTLTFTTAVNSPPVAVDDAPIIVTGPSTLTLSVLANDSDADAEPLTITAFTPAAQGTVVQTATGFTYTPAANFTGSDQFTYTIADPTGATATATVRLRTNAAPIGVDETYNDLVGPGPFLLSVLDNDSDPDGDPVSLAFAGTGIYGGNAGVSGQKVVFTPPAGYAGPADIYYAISDPYGKTSYAHAKVRVSLGRPTTPAARLMMSSGGIYYPGQSEYYLPANMKVTGFGPPALSDFGQLAATINLTYYHPYTGVVVMEPNHETKILTTSFMEAPGAVPSVFQSFSNPVLSPHGAVAFIARIKAPGPRGTLAQGIWSTGLSSDGSLALALKSGTNITGNGLPANSSIISFTSVEAVDGALFVLGQLSAPGGAVLLRIDATGVHVLLREKGTLSPGVTIQRLSILQPTILSPGQGRWGGASGFVAKATLSDKSTALLNIATDGTVTRLLSTWQVPTAGDAFAWSAFGLPALTPDGGAAFTGTLKTGAKPVIGWRGLATPETKLAEAGQTAPDAGTAQYSAFYDPVVNERGYAFCALLKGAGVTAANRLGFWWNDHTSTRKLARLGEGAPDAAGYVVSPAINGPRWQALSSYALPIGLQNGPVVLAKIVGRGVTATNNTGLWALDTAGLFRQILRTGPGALANDSRSIRSITTLAADAGAFGVGRSYNIGGSIAVKVIFTDNTQALLVIDVP